MTHPISPSSEREAKPRHHTLNNTKEAKSTETPKSNFAPKDHTRGGICSRDDPGSKMDTNFAVEGRTSVRYKDGTNITDGGEHDGKMSESATKEGDKLKTVGINSEKPFHPFASTKSTDVKDNPLA